MTTEDITFRKPPVRLDAAREFPWLTARPAARQTRSQPQ